MQGHCLQPKMLQSMHVWGCLFNANLALLLLLLACVVVGQGQQEHLIWWQQQQHCCSSHVSHSSVDCWTVGLPGGALSSEHSSGQQADGKALTALHIMNCTSMGGSSSRWRAEQQAGGK